MPDPSPRPASRRRSHRRRRRSRLRTGETHAAESLNPAERELLASFCPPGPTLLALGTGECREARAAACLGYRVTAVAVGPPPVLAAGAALPPTPRTGDRFAIEWLESDGLSLPVPSGDFDAVLIPLPVLERVPASVARIGLMREAARAARSGGHVLVSMRNGLSRPGWRRSLWELAERRAGEESGWRRLDPDAGHIGGGSAAVGSSRSPAELTREATAAGLCVAAELPWPPPPPGALGALARRGAACWHAAFEVA